MSKNTNKGVRHGQQTKDTKATWEGQQWLLTAVESCLVTQKMCQSWTVQGLRH